MAIISADERFLRQMGLKPFDEKEEEAAASEKPAPKQAAVKKTAPEKIESVPVPKPKPEKPKAPATKPPVKKASAKAAPAPVAEASVNKSAPISFRMPQELLDAMDREIARRNRDIIRPSEKLSRSQFILDTLTEALSK